MRLTDLARRRLAIAAIALLLAGTGGRHASGEPQLQAGVAPSWGAIVRTGALEHGITGARLLLAWGLRQLR